MSILKMSCGQALVEYLLIFSILAFIGVGMVKYFFQTWEGSAGSLAIAVSEHLSVGVCKSDCYNYSFKNKLKR